MWQNWFSVYHFMKEHEKDMLREAERWRLIEAARRGRRQGTRKVTGPALPAPGLPAPVEEDERWRSGHDLLLSFTPGPPSSRRMREGDLSGPQ